MSSCKTWSMLLIAAVAAVCAVPAQADFYDLFLDGSYGEDPNVWDIDDPCWIIFNPLDNPNAVAVQDGWFKLWTASGGFLPACAFFAYPDTGDWDPNTSETYWGHTLDHYVLAKTKNLDQQPDPNDNFGSSELLLHTNVFSWNGFAFEWIYRRYGSGYVLPRISAAQGLDWPTFQRERMDVTDPGFPDEAGGFWMLFAYYSDGNTDPEDPNGKFLRAALWNGDKYDWDGTWFLEVDLGEPNTWREPELILLSDEWWQPGGITAVGTVEYYNGEATAGYAQVEARTGVFDNDPKQLDLLIKNSKYGQVEINPDLPDPNDTYDPNTVDPNDGLTFPQERLLRFTTDTEVVLVAQPLPDRSFKNWTIYDPNFPGDGNYARLDSNAVLYLTMDADYQIEALFNCGSGLPPFVAMSFAALAVGVIVRRRG